MDRILSSLTALCFFVLGAVAQNDGILVTIGDNTVTKAEFEYIYRKNNSNLYNSSDKKSPKDYLELFIDFKLKVIEAESLKMDTDRVFINELAGYRKELAAPYLTDMNYNDQLVHDMYGRMTKEVNASHILLRVDRDAPPEKEKEVLDKISLIRAEILAGKDFGQAAVEYSEDPSARTNKGNLGYFSAFMMVYPFENAAYNTPVGEVSEPVRSAFGYHLVKVHDVRENRGEIRVAHIMKTFPQGMKPELKAEFKAEIDSIYQLVKEGADFAELAKKVSDDRRSATNGGELPWFSAGRIVPEFGNAAFALENNGDVSAPVETAYGYHIIKKLDHRPVPPFEEAKADIENKIKKDPERNNSSQKAFIAKLKKEYDFVENEAGKKSLEGKNIEDGELAEANLFTIDGIAYGTKELMAFTQKNKIGSGPYLVVYDQWVDHEIIALEDSRLEEKYPEFRYILKEYHDGILLFNISQEKIWNYAAEDTAGLEKYYLKHKGDHKWDERFKGYVITCQSPEIREEAEVLFSEGLTAEEVAEHLNTEQEVFTFEAGAWERGANPVVDYYVWNGPGPEDFNSETTFIRGDKVSGEVKTLDEARGLYISDYQNHLEKEWISQLRKKYKIKVNKKLLKTIEGV